MGYTCADPSNPYFQGALWRHIWIFEKKLHEGTKISIMCGRKKYQSAKVGQVGAGAKVR